MITHSNVKSVHVLICLQPCSPVSHFPTKSQKFLEPRTEGRIEFFNSGKRYIWLNVQRIRLCSKLSSFQTSSDPNASQILTQVSSMICVLAISDKQTCKQCFFPSQSLLSFAYRWTSWVAECFPVQIMQATVCSENIKGKQWLGESPETLLKCKHLFGA